MGVCFGLRKRNQVSAQPMAEHNETDQSCDSFTAHLKLKKRLLFQRTRDIKDKKETLAIPYS